MKHLLLALAATAFASSAAQAQFIPFYNLGDRPQETSLRGGIAVVSVPRFAGSDDRRTIVAPNVDAVWSNGWFASAINGVGYNFSTTKGMQFGLRAGIDFGRKSSGRLSGIEDISARPLIGGFFNYEVLPGLSFLSSMRFGSGVDRDGLTIDAGASYSLMRRPPWIIGLTGSVQWANSSYSQSAFGITPGQAAMSTTGLTPYTAKSGISEVGVGINATYLIDRRWSVTAVISTGRLQGDAASSPITSQRNQVFGLGALTYQF
jgi:MipA family protein